ncbi:apolipoprotein N-acyltransferase [Elizabethkingia sp. JS20170427COW]|uniref:apolipoprotein N-acyltransferase n=1 Tax=Elizabethkingia sp. JS20170427COW TaxID=2583851 RepID=UPI0011109FC0|nr:apolipoprotein N-acyltransferase [Elizabethkingia sp. JS20170427COW]QCX53533.1 apolipoprotein N-acyltransferase [Elizabethkingia sp. JS20170427COW]
MLKYFSLSILSGLLFAISWPANGIPIFIFFAFVPLMLLEHHLTNFSQVKRKGWAVFGYSFLTFFIWNIFTTWWLFNSKNPDGSHSITAVAVPTLLNSTMMSLVFLAYHYYKKNIGTYFGLTFLVALWLCFEKFHSTWEFSWPWLSLGNAFGGWHQWVQWYDGTGVLGGTLWILLANIAAYYGYRHYQVTRKRLGLLKHLAIFLAVVLIPLSLSLVKYNQQPTHSDQQVSAVLLQPALDPYTQKYNLDSLTITDNLLRLAKDNAQKDVDLFIAPETAIPGIGGISEKGFQHSLVIHKIKEFTQTYPKSTFITGASTYRVYPDEASKTETAYQIPNTNVWVDSYNTALEITPNQPIQTYHKGKLVPGVESFPYMSVLKPILGEAMLNMGGTIASLGSDKERKVFTNPFNKAKVAPVICYESAYGEYTTEYVRNGANLLAIVTNDSWWGFSPGHKQLLALAKLRAIETRRDVVRAANSGISAHINSRGDVVDSFPYGAQGALVVKASLYEEETAYVKYGDVVFRLAMFVLGFMVVYYASMVYMASKTKKSNQHKVK